MRGPLGVCVYADGVNSEIAGGTRVMQGLLGNEDGELNMLKQVEGKLFYNATQLVIGAFSIKQVLNAGLKNDPYGASGITKIACYLDEVTASGKSYFSHNFDLINLEETFSGMLPKKDNPKN